MFMLTTRARETVVASMMEAEDMLGGGCDTFEGWVRVGETDQPWSSGLSGTVVFLHNSQVIAFTCTWESKVGSHCSKMSTDIHTPVWDCLKTLPTHRIAPLLSSPPQAGKTSLETIWKSS